MERRVAILIGNGNHSDERFEALLAPSTDVSGLESVLGDPRIGGFEVLPLVDKTTREISIAISKAIKELSHKDTLLIYYSGHGVLDEAGKLHFATSDTSYDLLSATAISAQFIAQELDHCGSRRQIIILDCCYSGAFDRSRKSVAQRVNAALALEGEYDGRGRYLLTATDETQFAYDKDKLKDGSSNSVFTHYVLDGLKTGDADVDGDGQVSLDDLHAYVFGRAKSDRVSQTPYKWAYKARGKVFIARNVRSRGFDVRSLGALTDDILSSIISRHADIRLGAIATLSKLLSDADKAIVESATLALTHLSMDLDPRISAASVSARNEVAEMYFVPSVLSKGRISHNSVEERTVSLTLNVPLSFVRIPAGKFLMGSRPDDPLANPNEFPLHAVHVEDFWISKSPITIQQFAAFVAHSNYSPSSQKPAGVRKAFSRRNRRYDEIGYTWRAPFGETASQAVTRDHPVVLVNWHDAIAFCKWASATTGLAMDLPTEAEWEKAARGPDGRSWPWGNQNPDNSLCNFDERVGRTTPIGAYSPAGDSLYGCVDMAGNVWEWTNSEPHPYPFSDQYAGSTLSAGKRVLRGGSWRVKAYRLRCAFRKPWGIHECIDGHGFRIITKSI